MVWKQDEYASSPAWKLPTSCHTPRACSVLLFTFVFSCYSFFGSPPSLSVSSAFLHIFHSCCLIFRLSLQALNIQVPYSSDREPNKNELCQQKSAYVLGWRGVLYGRNKAYFLSSRIAPLSAKLFVFFLCVCPCEGIGLSAGNYLKTCSTLASTVSQNAPRMLHTIAKAIHRLEGVPNNIIK